MKYIKYLKECGFNDIEIETKLKRRNNEKTFIKVKNSFKKC